MTIRCAEHELHAMLWPHPSLVCFGMDPAGETIILYARGPCVVPSHHEGYPIEVRPIASMSHDINCGRLER